MIYNGCLRSAYDFLLLSVAFSVSRALCCDVTCCLLASADWFCLRSLAQNVKRRLFISACLGR